MWLDDLAVERDPHSYDLCFRHAERLSVLERLAAEALADGDEAGAALQVSASTTAKAVRVEAKRTVKRVVKASVVPETSAKIVVTGPRR